MQLVTLVSEFIDLILESSSLVVVMYEQAWARQGSRDWECKRKKKREIKRFISRLFNAIL